MIHRDIKPANIILGKHGETLVVDWGLAKPIGHVEPGPESGERPLTPSWASGSSETLPGSTLGTPAYMSPEQAEGRLDRLGPRSDIYSLGATLYCLLTGKPPLAGKVADMLGAVQRGEFPPPRQLDPSIDKALEAVCLKAMALEPEDRYGTPRALADDIEHWLADEPVKAHPEHRLERLGRWLRQHRSWTYAAVAALIAISLATTIGVVVVDQAQAPGGRCPQGGRGQLQHGPQGRRRLLDERQREHAVQTPGFRRHPQTPAGTAQFRAQILQGVREPAEP